MPSPVPALTPRARRTTRSAVWAVALVVLASVLGIAPSGAAEAPREQLEDIRGEIDATLAELEDVADRADQSEEALAEAEATVTRLEEELNQVLAAVTAQEERVAVAQAEADAAAAERDRIEKIAETRARRAFMAGVPSDLTLLSEVGSDDLGGVLDRLAFLDAIAARDAAAIESLESVRTRADAAADRLADELDALEEARATQEDVLARAEEVFAERADTLAALESQRERLLAEQEDLEAEEEELQELVRQQEEEARRRAEEEARRRAEEEAAAASSSGSSGGGASSGGGSEPAPDPDPPPPPPPPPPPSSGCYAWPAAGAVTSEFGPRWGRLHAGLDIDGNTGDAIYAAQSGTVTFVGWQGGYGQLTLIRHSDGVTTAYAHQSSVSVSSGQSVGRGQYIGAIGTTGAVTGSHLHFETRTSSGAVNPRNYLC